LKARIGGDLLSALNRHYHITLDACYLSIKRLTEYVSLYQSGINDLLLNKSVTLENEDWSCSNSP